MRRNVSAWVLACFALLVVFPAGAHEGVGALFSLGASGRALGMGGAFMALADDEGCVLHSPAGLGWCETIGITSLVASGFGGVAHGVVGFAMPYVGVDLFLLDSGAIPAGDGTVRYASQGIVGSIGVPLGPVALGVRGRILRVSSPGEGSGWAIDPGILVAVGGIRVGALVEGAVSDPVAYETGSIEAWGRSARLGAAITLAPAPDVVWSAAFEAAGLFASAPRMAAGLEAWIGGLGARAGFDGRGPTFGLSVRFAALQVDWAYAMRTDLGDSHRVSFTFRF